MRDPIVTVGGSKSKLGVSVLQNFVVVFDRQHAIVRLERAASDDMLMKSRRSIGVAVRRQPDRWSVRNILPFVEHAASVLRPDGTIISINGRVAIELDCDSLRALMASQDEIDFEMERCGRLFAVTLPILEVVH